MSMPVAILAGGLATRLGAVTASIPKALVDVGGRPFAEHQLQWLKGEGVSHVVFCVAHLGSMIQDALGDGARFGLRIEYVFDGAPLLGTAGALKRALPVLGDRFFVLYGDSLLTCPLGPVEQAFRESGRAALMTVYRNDDRFDRSNVLFEDGRLQRYDKMSRTENMRHIDYGLGVLSAMALEPYSPGEPFELATVYRDIANQGRLAAYEVTSRFYEIGSPDGLEETREYLQSRRPESE